MDRWVTVKRIQQAALEKDVGQRAVFLDDACGGDEGLRREVESLLAYEDEAASFMELPAVEASSSELSEARLCVSTGGSAWCDLVMLNAYGTAISASSASWCDVLNQNCRKRIKSPG